MKFRMVSEYDFRHRRMFFWTERKEFLFGWLMVAETLSSSQVEAEDYYFRIVSSNGYKKKVIHESWKLYHDR